MNLLRGNPPSKRESNTTINCVSRVRKKLEDLHEIVRKLLGNEWTSNLLKLKPGIIKKSGKYNLMLDRRFGFIILVRKREELPNYRVVGRAHILLLEN